MWKVPPRWDPSRSHRAISRVDVWSQGVWQGSSTRVDFEVTEEYVSGQRMSLSLTVPKTKQWQRWLALPYCELQPWLGMGWGRTELLLPMGVYAVEPAAVSIVGSELSVSGADLWSRVKKATFSEPRASIKGTSTSLQIAHLLQDVHLGEPRIHPDTLDRTANPIIDVTRDATVPQLVWEDRSEACLDLADSIGAEVFMDRYGAPRIQTRRNPVGRPLREGDGGTVLDVSTTEDWSDVVNVVSVKSTANDVEIPVATVMINNPNHPAHRSRIGEVVHTMQSNLTRDWGQAWNLGVEELRRRAAPAMAWEIECVPDPSRQAGDLCDLSCSLGDVTGIVQKVIHPSKGTSSVTLSAQLDPGL